LPLRPKGGRKGGEKGRIEIKQKRRRRERDRACSKGNGLMAQGKQVISPNKGGGAGSPRTGTTMALDEKNRRIEGKTIRGSHRRWKNFSGKGKWRVSHKR